MNKNYETPSVKEQEFFPEGILCMSGTTNESYGSDPSEDGTIF